MYFYVVKEFKDIGVRYLKVLDGKVLWATTPPRSYEYNQARELANTHNCEVVEV